GVGHGLAALAGDDDAQLGLEVEGLVARRAIVEVVLDAAATLGRQLTVEVAVQLVQSVVAVSVSHSSPSCHKAASYGELPQLLLEAFSSPMQSAHHRSD